MIVNLDKCQAIVLDKRRSNNIEAKFIIGSEQIQAVPLVDILDIIIDNKLNFNLRIDKNEEREALINSFVLSNFNCPLVLILTNAKSVHKIEAIQKRALRCMFNDYESFYEDLL